MSQTNLFVDFDGNKYVDEVESSVIVHGNSYRAIQMETFASLHTTPSDWTPCEIKDVFDLPNGGEEVIYIFPDGYTEVPHNQFDESTGGLRCQLCGHPITYTHFIQCDSKQLILQVGSECINTYHGAHYTDKMIKTFKDNRIREQYRIWRGHIITDIETHTRPNSTWLPYDLFKLKQKILKTDALKTTSRKLSNLMKKGNTLLQKQEVD